MKSISKAAWFYLVYGLIACGYFSTAAVNRWRGPDFDSDGSGSSGSSYGRSSGGSWGGGK